MDEQLSRIEIKLAEIEGKVEVPEDLRGSIIVAPTFPAEKAEVANVTPKATKKNPNPKQLKKIKKWKKFLKKIRLKMNMRLKNNIMN